MVASFFLDQFISRISKTSHRLAIVCDVVRRQALEGGDVGLHAKLPDRLYCSKI